MAVHQIVALVVALTGCVTDLRTRRIPNVLTFSAAAAAVVFHGVTAGLTGVGHSLSGLAVGLVIFLPLFALRGLGGGDVKLLAALGAWMGPGATVWMALWAAIAGGPLGLLTGLVVSTGPLTVPLFTFHGLERGALLGTEAAASIGMYGAKVATFQALGAFPLEVLAQGLLVGATLMAGSFAGRFIVLALSPGAYRTLIDALMLCSGVSLLWAGLR